MTTAEDLDEANREHHERLVEMLKRLTSDDAKDTW